jgi:hypothetical protein
MSQEVLLYTQDLPAAKGEIASLGGRITQQLSNKVIVVNLPETVNSESLIYATTVKPSDLDQVSQIAANAWESLRSKRESQAPSPAEGLPWDAPGYQPPLKVQDEERLLRADAAESTGTPTSLYMVGSVAVGVVIVSGPPPNQPGQSNLSFSDAERQTVIQEVQEGLSFLANAEPRANVSFVYDIRLINVTVVPGNTSDYESAEAPWRDAALGQMGFSASRQGSIDYVRQLRLDRGTEWAYVVYFTKYTLHHFAYAVDEKVCMEYSNDGWGSDLINRVFAHESCHIFGAADEYGSCVCGGSNGYLGIPNNNCVNCGGTHVSCLMERNELTMCQWTRGQIGWDNRLFNRPSQVWVSGQGNWAWSGSKVIAGDFLGSGKTDIAVLYGYPNSETGLWLFTSDSNFQPIQVWVSGQGNWEWSRSKVIAGDFLGSGKTDIAVLYDYPNSETGLWLFTSDSNFQPIQVWVSGQGNWEWSLSEVILGDFQGDGKAEIAVFYSYPNSETGMWLFGGFRI